MTAHLRETAIGYLDAMHMDGVITTANPEPSFSSGELKSTLADARSIYLLWAVHSGFCAPK